MKKKLSIAGIAITGIGAVVFGFVLFFNRAPERTIPEGSVIVAPASGRIIHIEQVPTRTVSFFKKDIENVLEVSDIDPPYTIVVIEMDPLDVHVQRAPLSGSVVYQEHMPGLHKNALSGPEVHKLSNINEKNIVVFENNDLAVGVVQVAGRAARRIRNTITTGDALRAGDIYGRIILGSQVVVILPESVAVTARIGDILTDGESIIGTYK